MKIPFVSKVTKATKVVSDSVGNHLEVPIYGSITPREAIETGRYLIGEQASLQSQNEVELAIVAIFLSNRFKQSVTPDELLELAPSFELIHELFQVFYYDERKIPRFNPVVTEEDSGNPEGK